jgi:L-2-hydroxycarboxylate dehydrogenase (NAD+)
MHLEADLRGIGIQGIDHLCSLIEDLRSGDVDPRSEPSIARDLGPTVLIDGHDGLGVPAALLAVDIAKQRCPKYGSCIVGITKSSDIFMLGYDGDALARSGFVAVLGTNSPPRVYPQGGTEAVLGTNPLVIAIPSGGSNPILLDMATSHWAASYFRQAAYHGEEIPEGLAYDSEGHPTTDPSEALRGAIAPLAGHKGFGLGMCMGLLTGPLVGMPVGKALSGGYTLGHLFITIDPAAFGDPQAFIDGVDSHIREVKNSRKAPSVDEIRIPGERTFATRERQLRHGIKLYEAVWQRAHRLASELGVSVPM